MLIRLFAGWSRFPPLSDSGNDRRFDLGRSGRALVAVGSTRPPSLRHTEKINSPATTGWFRPTVLVPSGLLSNSSVRDAVLLHESAHVRRGDAGWQFLLRLVQAVYWFHPLVWLLGRMVGRLREKACDAVCVRTLGAPDLSRSADRRRRIDGHSPHRLDDRHGGFLPTRGSARVPRRKRASRIVEPALPFDGALRAVCSSPSCLRPSNWSRSLPSPPRLNNQNRAALAKSPASGGESCFPMGGLRLERTSPCGRSSGLRDHPPSHTTKANQDGRWSLSIPKS